jgi:GNAT superfamily N-acetyltransferase
VERVRRAGPQDSDRCRDLLATARAESAAARGGDLLVPPDADPSSWLDQPDRVLFVGLFDEVVVGLAAGRVVVDLAVDRAAGQAADRIGHVDCCYVETGARGVGVGESLIGGLLGWFGEQGCTGVDALALPGDRSTKQLLENAGFKARLLVLHRRLP